MRKATPFLLWVAIMGVLTLLQRLFLVQSDTDKQWALMAMWFGLCTWFLRSPQTHSAHACQPEATTVPASRTAPLGNVRNQKPQTTQMATQTSVPDHLYMPIEIGLTQRASNPEGSD
jgi:hypothetical protein